MLLKYAQRPQATTVYLVDRRFDMLPSILSSDLCSLRGNEDRCAVSVFWELTPPVGDDSGDGGEGFQVRRKDSVNRILKLTLLCAKVIANRTRFGRTAIHSVAAMTYDQADRLLDGKAADRPGSSGKKLRPGEAGATVPTSLHAGLRHDLLLLRRIARTRKKKRMEDGALELSEGGELTFKLDQFAVRHWLLMLNVACR